MLALHVKANMPFQLAIQRLLHFQGPRKASKEQALRKLNEKALSSIFMLICASFLNHGIMIYLSKTQIRW